MKISVLTPTFNRADTFLPECLASVRGRYGDTDYEHIVADDRSTDGTWELLTAAARDDSRLRPVQTAANGGPGRALNSALAVATGDFVLPLDDDDMLLPRSLDMHERFLTKHPEVDLAFGWAVLVRQDGRLDMSAFETYGGDLSSVPYSDDHDKFLRLMLQGSVIFNSTAVIRRSAATSVGGWSEEVDCQDWEMFTKLVHAGHRHRLNRAYLSAYRVHDTQATARHISDGTYARDGAYIRRKYGAV